MPIINCANKFQQATTIVDLIAPNTVYGGSLPSPFIAKYYKFDLAFNQTVFFTLDIVPHTTAPINVVFTLYRKETNGDYTNLGASLSNLGHNNFSYSAQQDSYYICITTDFSVDYTLVGSFTVFNSIVNMQAEANHGSTGAATIKPKVAFCNSVVIYEIIDGVLPPGLTFGGGGYIYGTPTELDCVSDENTPPSYALSQADDDGATRSLTVDFPFTVRAKLQEEHSTFADRSFKICVHNNWSDDEAYFLGQRDNWIHDIKVEEGNEAWALIPDIEHPTPMLKLESDCPDMEPLPTPPVLLTEMEINELCPNVLILPEFQNDPLVPIIPPEACEPCKEPDDETAFEFQEIESICPIKTGSKESLIIFQEIPMTMCEEDKDKDEIETVELQTNEINQIKIVDDMPQLCYLVILDDMKNKKNCNGRPPCTTYQRDLASMVPIKKVPKILKSLCEEQNDNATGT